MLKPSFFMGFGVHSQEMLWGSKGWNGLRKPRKPCVTGEQQQQQQQPQPQPQPTNKQRNKKHIKSKTNQTTHLYNLYNLSSPPPPQKKQPAHLWHDTLAMLWCLRIQKQRIQRWPGQRLGTNLGACYLEDHPSGCKWLITMVIVSPLNGVIPLINGLNGL